MQPTPHALLMMLGIVLMAAASTGCAAVASASQPSLYDYRSLHVEWLKDDAGGSVPPGVRDAIARQFKIDLESYGFEISGKRKAQARLQLSILSCPSLILRGDESARSSELSECFAAAVLVDSKTGHTVTKWTVKSPALSRQETEKWPETDVVSFAHSMAEQTARLLYRTQVPADALAGDVLTAGGAHIVYQGDGVFVVSGMRTRLTRSPKTTVVDLRRIRHGHDPAIDDDVPDFTNVTLNDVVPAFVDEKGRSYARITLYHVNPPLAGLPSSEPGIDRGIDFRTPADLVKSAYSNYVSPVLSNDAERLRIQSHPIGHFYVRVEIPGYPTLLTGMTTIKRSDAELTEMTIGRELGIGGVLLTPQPGRLNASAEAVGELALRQRELRVIDGLHYDPINGKNLGPEYVQRDGNVVFARFKVPLRNAKDALAYFVEFLARGEHNTFGSLVNRPNKGTGAGCTPFAISWLEASGVIPFLVEPVVGSNPRSDYPTAFDPANFWKYFLRKIDIPWQQIGCDDRLGLNGIMSAKYTIYDLLFHGLPRRFIEKASAGLAQKIKENNGAMAGTLFQFGALTPIRDLVIYSKRKDPRDLGDYAWAKDGEGLRAQYWDNSRFSRWIDRLWQQGTVASNMHLLREGRFKGVEVDATAVPRQKDVFFGEADEIARKRADLAAAGFRASTCERLFSLGIQ